MAKAKFLWDICSWESFKNQDWEEKIKWTKVWALFQNEETWKFRVNFLNQWMSVFPKKDKWSEIESDKDFEKRVKKEKEREELTIEDIPF